MWFYIEQGKYGNFKETSKQGTFLLISFFLILNCLIMYTTVKPVQNGHTQKYQILAIKTNYHLMQVKSIAEKVDFI